ncbi:MAG: response regulator [Planctomycetales bacterium]|nr:response regulator [Planctomycetales bacterium]
MNSKKSILVADTDRALVREISMYCQYLGLKPIKAYNARSTFELILEHSPDLICVDSRLQANGLTVCEVLSRDADFAKIPVILLADSESPAELAGRTGDMCVYCVQKSQNILRSIEPVVFELVDIEPVPQPEGQ